MRAWLYDRLKFDPDLSAFHNGSVYPREVLRSANPEALPRPFLIYGLGNCTAEGLIGDDPADQDPERQFFTVWIHDVPADYMQIDNMIPLVKKLLTHSSSPQDRVLTIRWLETSQEFDDKALGTILRYIRFQAIRA